MYSDILSSESSEGLENINDLPFLLDPETGEISLNFDPQKGWYYFYILHYERLLYFPDVYYII